MLDNFEHLTEAAPEVAGLVGSCLYLAVLVTSRAALRVRGEREYPVPPLELPDRTQALDAEEVVTSPAVELFVARAQSANPVFTLTRHNAATAATICRRLDGLPLALELAAAHARFLGLTALLSRRDRALEAGGARDLPERQQTMKATLRWSHNFLSEEERMLFRRLSVFVGGFSLEAAEAVGEGRENGTEGVLSLLGRLVEQSLVVAADAGEEGEEVRYRMLEPIRQYALEELEESGEAQQTWQRHAEFFLVLAEAAEPELKGPDQVEWLERLEKENGNLRAAMGWTLSTERPRPPRGGVRCGCSGGTAAVSARGSGGWRQCWSAIFHHLRGGRRSWLPALWLSVTATTNRARSIAKKH